MFLESHYPQSPTFQFYNFNKRQIIYYIIVYFVDYDNKFEKLLMNVRTLDSENLVVDWLSFNLEGLMDPRIIARRLSKHFTPHVLMDDVPSIGFHGFKKKYKVSIRQYTGSKGYWVGTKIIFSGKDAAYFYKLIKTQRFDWGLLKFDEHSLSLGRIDLCFSRPNDLNHTNNSVHYRVYPKNTV